MPRLQLHHLPGRWTTVGLRLFFIAGTLAILGLAIFSLHYMQSGFSAMDDIQRYSETSLAIDQLEMRLVNAETGLRGYLLTGLPSYLEPYEVALGEVDRAIDNLGKQSVLVRQQPVKLARLLAASSAARDSMRVLLSAHWPQSGALDRKALDDSKLLMDQVRTLIAELRSHVAQAAAEAHTQSAHQLRVMSNVLLGLSITVACLIVWMFFTADAQISLRNRLADVLRQQKLELERLVQIRTQELAHVSRMLNDAQENERHRLARELHDELGSILTAARIEAAAIRDELAVHEVCTKSLPRFERLIKWLGEGIAIKRRVIDDLRPPLLDSLGLVDSLRELGEDFQRRVGIPIKMSLPDEDPALSATQTLALYRIAQEALTNIQKHAEAHQVSVEMDEEDDWISLAIIDDGKGFNPDQSSGKKHGLLGIRHRLNIYDGTLDLRSEPGKGTRLVAHVRCERDAEILAS